MIVVEEQEQLNQNVD